MAAPNDPGALQIHNINTDSPVSCTFQLSNQVISSAASGDQRLCGPLDQSMASLRLPLISALPIKYSCASGALQRRFLCDSFPSELCANKVPMPSLQPNSQYPLLDETQLHGAGIDINIAPSAPSSPALCNLLRASPNLEPVTSSYFNGGHESSIHHLTEQLQFQTILNEKDAAHPAAPTLARPSHLKESAKSIHESCSKSSNVTDVAEPPRYIFEGFKSDELSAIPGEIIMKTSSSKPSITSNGPKDAFKKDCAPLKLYSAATSAYQHKAASTNGANLRNSDETTSAAAYQALQYPLARDHSIGEHGTIDTTVPLTALKCLPYVVQQKEDLVFCDGGNGIQHNAKQDGYGIEVPQKRLRSFTCSAFNTERTSLICGIAAEHENLLDEPLAVLQWEPLNALIPTSNRVLSRNVLSKERAGRRMNILGQVEESGGMYICANEQQPLNTTREKANYRAKDTDMPNAMLGGYTCEVSACRSGPFAVLPLSSMLWDDRFQINDQCVAQEALLHDLVVCGSSAPSIVGCSSGQNNIIGDFGFAPVKQLDRRCNTDEYFASPLFLSTEYPVPPLFFNQAPSQLPKESSTKLEVPTPSLVVSNLQLTADGHPNKLPQYSCPSSIHQLFRSAGSLAHVGNKENVEINFKEAFISSPCQLYELFPVHESSKDSAQSNVLNYRTTPFGFKLGGEEAQAQEQRRLSSGPSKRKRVSRNGRSNTGYHTEQQIRDSCTTWDKSAEQEDKELVDGAALMRVLGAGKCKKIRAAMQRLRAIVPGACNREVDTSEALKAAALYLQFLHAQITCLHNELALLDEDAHQVALSTFHHLSGFRAHEFDAERALLHRLLMSSHIQQALLQQGSCLVTTRQARRLLDCTIN